MEAGAGRSAVSRDVVVLPAFSGLRRGSTDKGKNGRDSPSPPRETREAGQGPGGR